MEKKYNDAGLAPFVRGKVPLFRFLIHAKENIRENFTGLVFSMRGDMRGPSGKHNENLSAAFLRSQPICLVCESFEGIGQAHLEAAAVASLWTFK